MNQGLIDRLPGSREVHRDDARLPSAWVDTKRAPSTVAGLSWLTSEAMAAPPRAEPNSPVLVMLRSDNKTPLEQLLAHAMSGERTYVLAPEGWGKGEVEPQLLRSPKVLIRKVPEVPASAVHSASGSRVWIGGSWSLRLDAAQAHSFRQVFLRLFWHDAVEEAWSGGQQFVWRVAGERPFDVPDTSLRSPVRLVAGEVPEEFELRGALMHLAKGSPPDCAPRRLLTPAGPDHHDVLARLVRNGVDVAWEHRDLPDLVVNGDDGLALLPGSRARLRIRLTAAQAREAARVLEAPAAWRFAVDLRIGDPALSAATFWLPGEAKPRSLEKQQIIDVPDVAASTLGAMRDLSPATVPPPQPLTRSVLYRWHVAPPRIPVGSEEDALVGRWRRVDEDWKSRLSRARDALTAAEGSRGRLAGTFSRLMSAMLGFERTQSGLLAQVASLLSEAPPSSFGPTGAQSMLSQLVAIENQVQRLQGDLEESERKAREDDEREKQRSTWTARIEDAKRTLAGRRTELAEAESRQDSVSAALSETQASLKSAEKEPEKDLRARERKLSDEQARTNKEVSRLRETIKVLEQDAEAAFEFHPPASPTNRPPQSGTRFVPPSMTNRVESIVPDDALPEAGILRKHKDRRYLIIKTWEDLAAGEQAATRLSAILVAPEST